MMLQHHQFVQFNSVALLLSLLTWLLYEKVDHFTDVGDELLQNHSFESGLAGWHSSRNVDKDQVHTVNLSNWKSTEGHYIHQSLVNPASSIVRISADIEIVNVKIGPEGWQSARIDVFGRETGGKWRWDFPNTLFQETGTLKLRNISKVIHIPDEYSEIRVESELTGGTGTFLIERISLTEVESLLSVKLLTYLLLACWLALGLGSTIGLISLKMWLPSTTMAFIGVLLLLIQESFKLEILQRLEEWIPVINNFPFDHLFLFFMATLIICFSTSGKQNAALWQVVFSLVTFSLATEVLQYFTTHREPRLLDSIMNLVGILSATLLFLFIQSFGRSRV